MKVLNVAFKDMRQAFRSRTAIIFMFVVPILVTVLFALMFGNIAGGDAEFSLPLTQVVVVNLDEGVMPAQAPQVNAANMGALLRQLLGGEELRDLIALTDMTDVAAARATVDNQEAGVALIIPADFTMAIAGGGPPTSLELYTDPTLTIGPALVESIVGQYVDTFSAATIGVGVTVEQIAEAGVPLTDERIEEIVGRYTEMAQSSSRSELVTIVPPPGADEGSELAGMLALILGGMMVFYVFFTGANTLNSILTEQERGTLQRLFTTPTPELAIFSGKFLATIMTLIVQVTVLLLFGRFVFSIQWGDPAKVAMAAAGLIVLAATTGLFLVSFIKTPRQAGVIFGGLLTLTGMLGLISVFTASAGAPPPALNTISLLVPQGWAIRGLRQAMDGAASRDLLLTLGAIAVWSALFFVIGQRRLQRRFGWA